MIKKNKIKIFFFNPYPSIGGLDTTLRKFINNLDLNNYDIEYLSLKKIKTKFNKNINYTILDKNSTFLSYFQIFNIVKNDIAKKKIFFSSQYFTNVWTVLFLKRIKRLKIFLYEVNHIDELNNHKNIKDYFKKKIIKFLVKIVYEKADIIAGNSSQLSSDLSKYINKKVTTLYNPCYYKTTKRISNSKNFKKIKILNIARLDHQKDHLTLLKAINHSKIKDQIKLILVGDGPNKYMIKEYAKMNKIDVSVLTNKTKLDLFYLKSNLYISTSLYEGLPTTMVEAASYNLPIISSNFKSGPSEILNNGKGGFLFRIKNYAELTKLIEKFFLNQIYFIKKPKLQVNQLKNFPIRKILKNLRD